MNEKIVSPTTYVVTWLLLMAGFVLTLCLSRMNLHGFNILVAITIAFLQMALVIVYFMHTRYSTRLTWIFAAMGFFWMGILLLLGLSDYLSRGWLH